MPGVSGWKIWAMINYRTVVVLIAILLSPVLAEPTHFAGIYESAAPPKVCPGFSSFVVRDNLEGAVSADGKTYAGSGTWGKGDEFDFQTATVGDRSYHLVGKFSGKVFTGTLTRQMAAGETSSPVRLHSR